MEFILNRTNFRPVNSFDLVNVLKHACLLQILIVSTYSWIKTSITFSMYERTMFSISWTILSDCPSVYEA